MKQASLLALSTVNVFVSAKTYVTANYDDLRVHVPTTNSILAYEGLFYNAWDLTPTSPDAVGGVIAHSKPNKIITGNQDQIAHGIPSFAVLPPYKSVRLLDFWFGCATRTDENYSNRAEECNITLSAYTQSKSQTAIGSAQFTFIPNRSNSPIPSNLTHAILPNAFTALEGIVQITVVPSNPTVNGLLIDDLHYELIYDGGCQT